ncbi:MAG: MBL fold metallo-hydrolase [Candidatus Bathyarchaeota archaeon]|nr:MBL fold metallo-hydrolase [Candidatus Bathyarchaeota archaeon]
MEIKWLGHASWKLKTGEITVYIDPYAGEYDEEADLILSTHHHDDHCKPDKIEMVKGDKTVIVAPPECGKKLGTPVTSLKPGESMSFGDVTVKAVEAYNFKRFRSPGTPFHPKGIGVGYLVKAEGKTVYHVGDSDYIEEMNDLKGLDLVLIPSGGTYTMDGPEAAEATIAMNPAKAVPMHIWDTDPAGYKKQVEAGCDTEVIVMKPGETLSL